MPRWRAQPHTLAKIDILRQYLDAWFSILGTRSPDRPLFYIDGFAGPGRYEEGQPGSPLVAMECARNALISAFQSRSWRAGHIYCLFVETSKENLTSLQSDLATIVEHRWVHHQTYLGDFDTVLTSVEQQYPTAFGDAPLFVFLDPFGPTGLTFNTVARVLASPRSEVMLHFDADGATRMIQALEDGYNRSSAAHLTRIFGGTEWQDAIVQDEYGRVDFDKTTRKLVRIYLAHLRSLAEYAYPFQMITPLKTESSEVGYYLIFASNHPLGLKRMKESMRRVGQDRGYTFSNFRSQRPLLFTADRDTSVDALLLYQHFRGQSSVTWREVLRWVLNETAETSPKGLLSYLERQGLIEVQSPEVRKRRFTYPERIEESLLFDFSGDRQDG